MTGPPGHSPAAGRRTPIRDDRLTVQAPATARPAQPAQKATAATE